MFTEQTVKYRLCLSYIFYAAVLYGITEAICIHSLYTKGITIYPVIILLIAVFVHIYQTIKAIRNYRRSLKDEMKDEIMATIIQL